MINISKIIKSFILANVVMISIVLIAIGSFAYLTNDRFSNVFNLWFDTGINFISYYLCPVVVMTIFAMSKKQNIKEC